MSLHLTIKPREEATQWNLPLGIQGFRFADLNRVRRIATLDQIFCEELAAADPQLAVELQEYRKGNFSSDVLIRVGAYVGPFVARLFRIEAEVQQLREKLLQQGRIFEWKKKFLDKRVLKTQPSAAEMAGWDLDKREIQYREVVSRVLGSEHVHLADDPERELAEVGLRVLEPADGEEKGIVRPGDLEILENWAKALAFHPELRSRSKGFSSFTLPEKIDYQNLVPLERLDPKRPEKITGKRESRRFRDGFKLTDNRMSQRESMHEVHYCIYCHERDKDSCSKGMHKQGQVQKNPLGIPLEGCPLDEKISEAHTLRRDGHAIGALAAVMVDN